MSRPAITLSGESVDRARIEALLAEASFYAANLACALGLNVSTDFTA